MEALGLLESETPITKDVDAFLLVIVVKTFILYLKSGRTNGSIISPIILELKFSFWELQRGQGLGSTLTRGKECHLLSLWLGFANWSMQSIVFNPNSDSVQSGNDMSRCCYTTRCVCTSQRKLRFYMLIARRSSNLLQCSNKIMT